MGASWVARPEIVSCYQCVPDHCQAHGEWSGTDGSLFWIHGSRPALAANRELAGSDAYLGLEQVELDYPAPGSGPLRRTLPFTLGDVWGRNRNDVFAVGKQGVILHFDGTAWTREAADGEADLRAVSGNGDEVFAVGDGGTILRRRTDGHWTREPSPVRSTLRDVASTRDGMFAVGDDGVVLHRAPPD